MSAVTILSSQVAELERALRSARATRTLVYTTRRTAESVMADNLVLRLEHALGVRRYELREARLLAKSAAK